MRFCTKVVCTREVLRLNTWHNTDFFALSWRNIFDKSGGRTVCNPDNVRLTTMYKTRWGRNERTRYEFFLQQTALPPPFVSLDVWWRDYYIIASLCTYKMIKKNSLVFTRCPPTRSVRVRRSRDNLFSRRIVRTIWKQNDHRCRIA